MIFFNAQVGTHFVRYEFDKRLGTYSYILFSKEFVIIFQISILIFFTLFSNWVEPFFNFFKAAFWIFRFSTSFRGGNIKAQVNLAIRNGASCVSVRKRQRCDPIQRATVDPADLVRVLVAPVNVEITLKCNMTAPENLEGDNYVVFFGYWATFCYLKRCRYVEQLDIVFL